MAYEKYMIFSESFPYISRCFKHHLLMLLVYTCFLLNMHGAELLRLDAQLMMWVKFTFYFEYFTIQRVYLVVAWQ